MLITKNKKDKLLLCYSKKFTIQELNLNKQIYL